MHDAHNPAQRFFRSTHDVQIIVSPFVPRGFWWPVYGESGLICQATMHPTDFTNFDWLCEMERLAADA